MEIQTVEINESELIEKAKKDPKEFSGLYDAYFHQVFHFIFRRVNEKEISADLTQQVFFHALTSIQRYQDRGKPFGAYLYRIAINECNQYFRDRSKTRFVSIENHGVELMMDEIEPDFEMEMEFKRSTLQNALQRLDTNSVTLIELRYFEKLSYQEIADILDIKENLAKVKVHRLLKKMKKQIANGK